MTMTHFPKARLVRATGPLHRNSVAQLVNFGQFFVEEVVMCWWKGVQNLVDWTRFPSSSTMMHFSTFLGWDDCNKACLSVFLQLHAAFLEVTPLKTNMESRKSGLEDYSVKPFIFLRFVMAFSWGRWRWIHAWLWLSWATYAHCNARCLLRSSPKLPGHQSRFAQAGAAQAFAGAATRRVNKCRNPRKIIHRNGEKYLEQIPCDDCDDTGI